MLGPRLLGSPAGGVAAGGALGRGSLPLGARAAIDGVVREVRVIAEALGDELLVCALFAH